MIKAVRYFQDALYGCLMVMITSKITVNTLGADGGI